MAGYIKFDGIDGEAKDKDHDKWSDILSVSQAVSKPGRGATGPTRRRGDTIMEDIVVTKELDKSSPKIAEAVCKGKVFPKVEIHLTASYTDAGRVTYYAYELTNTQVTRYDFAGSGQSEDVPTEDLALNFEEIKVTYTETDSEGSEKGNIEYTWKVEEGEA
jgi:type VI secretion system secreted protein Hcp